MLRFLDMEKDHHRSVKTRDLDKIISIYISGTEIPYWNVFSGYYSNTYFLYFGAIRRLWWNPPKKFAIALHNTPIDIPTLQRVVDDHPSTSPFKLEEVLKASSEEKKNAATLVAGAWGPGMMFIREQSALWRFLSCPGWPGPKKERPSLDTGREASWKKVSSYPIEMGIQPSW